MAKRAGLNAVPVGWPRWYRVARAYLAGLKRKDGATYRGIRGRLAESWPELGPTWERVICGALASEAGLRFATRADAAVLCALTLECFVWWAAEERDQVGDLRHAEHRLIELQAEIERSANDLCEAIDHAEALCNRHGLFVNAPMWNNDLCEVLQEIAHKFGRWGSEPEVRALVAFEARSFYSPSPSVVDVVRAAQTAGVLRSDLTKHARDAETGELRREIGPEVRALDGRAAEALRVRGGSKATSEAAQLRQLFASLNRVALYNGLGQGGAGPLVWLSDDDISRLCCVSIGDDRRVKAHPWGSAFEGFSPETVRKARTAFLAARRSAGKPDR